MGVCEHPDVKIARRIDIRFVSYPSFYAALLYFTGSCDFNKHMRTVALKKRYTLNEYGLYKFSGEIISTNSEEEIFDILEMKYLSPKDREI
jgi:DNA polymerase/3'-5' exonuclease PolX